MITIGNSNLSNIKYGNQNITAVYAGDTLIWPVEYPRWVPKTFTISQTDSRPFYPPPGNQFYDGDKNNNNYAFWRCTRYAETDETVDSDVKNWYNEVWNSSLGSPDWSYDGLIWTCNNNVNSTTTQTNGDQCFRILNNVFMLKHLTSTVSMFKMTDNYQWESISVSGLPINTSQTFLGCDVYYDGTDYYLGNGVAQYKWLGLTTNNGNTVANWGSVAFPSGNIRNTILGRNVWHMNGETYYSTENGDIYDGGYTYRITNGAAVKNDFKLGQTITLRYVGLLGENIWDDGNGNFYFSDDSAQLEYRNGVSGMAWYRKEWPGNIAPKYGKYIWHQGSHVYYSDGTVNNLELKIS